ncbi:unnamed protein product [Penicillium crustosum]
MSDINNLSHRLIFPTSTCGTPAPPPGHPGKYARKAVNNIAAEEKAETQAMTLLAGLRGPALDFAYTRPQEIHDKFEEKFPQRPIE